MSLLPQTEGNSRLGQRHAQLQPLLRQPGIELLDHASGPLGINLPGRVLSFPQHHVAPLIHQMSHLGIIRDFFRQLRRYKRNSLGISDRNIPRHHCRLPDTNRYINARQHHIFERRRIDPPHIALETLDLLDSRLVANGAIYNQSILALSVNGRRQIIANDRSVANLAKKIDDQYIAGLKNINDPRVLIANPAFFLSIRLNDGVDIRPARHEHCRHRSPDQPLTRIDNLPAAFELIAKTCVLEGVPSLFRANRFQTLQHGAGNPRTPIGKTLAVPVRGKSQALFTRKETQLSLRRNNKHHCYRGDKDSWDQCSLAIYSFDKQQPAKIAQPSSRNKASLRGAGEARL